MYCLKIINQDRNAWLKEKTPTESPKLKRKRTQYTKKSKVKNT